MEKSVKSFWSMGLIFPLDIVIILRLVERPQRRLTSCMTI